MDASIRVLMVASYPLLQVGMEALLASVTDVELVAVAAGKYQASVLCRQHQPHVLLLNVADHAIAEYLLHHLRQQCTTYVLLLTAADDVHMHHTLLGSVTGHALLDEPPDMLLRAIRTVAKGRTWYSQAIAQKLCTQQHNLELCWQDLTNNEQKLLCLLAKNYTNEQIAAELGFGLQTIRNYCHNLYHKLHVHARHEAVVWLYKQNGAS